MHSVVSAKCPRTPLRTSETRTRVNANSCRRGGRTGRQPAGASCRYQGRTTASNSCLTAPSTGFFTPTPPRLLQRRSSVRDGWPRLPDPAQRLSKVARSSPGCIPRPRGERNRACGLGSVRARVSRQIHRHLSSALPPVSVYDNPEPPGSSVSRLRRRG